MANPFTKKNPLLSMWLSAANAWAGAARGLMTAEAKRSLKGAAKPAGKPPARKKRKKF